MYYKPGWWPRNPYPQTVTITGSRDLVDAIIDVMGYRAWDDASNKIQAALCEMLEKRIKECEEEITIRQKESASRYKPESPEYYRYQKFCDNTVRAIRFEIRILEEMLEEIRANNE